VEIAFIDFDGTLTRKDTFIQFMKRMIPWWKYLLGMGIIGLWYPVYVCRIISSQQLKEKALHFFLAGKNAGTVREKSKWFAMEVLPGLLTEQANMLLASYRKKKIRIVIVTASLDLWLEPWCRAMDYDLICSRAEIINGKITGRLEGKNCRGTEKVNRIKKQYNLADHTRIFVHGDSKQDKEMLKLGTDSYYKWKKISM